MNNKHRKTLEAIFSHPTPLSLEWRRIEALFVGLGVRIIDKDGSEIDASLHGERAHFHRPHPQKEAKPYQVRDARNFLASAGIKP